MTIDTRVILLDGVPIAPDQTLVPCCAECGTGQFVRPDFICVRGPSHAVHDTRTTKRIWVARFGTCWICGEQCAVNAFDHPECKREYGEELKACRCADILKKDKSRHFKECPKRGEHPDPSVQRALDAEARVKVLEEQCMKLHGDIEASKNASFAHLARREAEEFEKVRALLSDALQVAARRGEDAAAFERGLRYWKDKAERLQEELNKAVAEHKRKP